MMPGKLSNSLSHRPTEPHGSNSSLGRGDMSSFDTWSLVTRAHYLLSVTHLCPSQRPPHLRAGAGSVNLPSRRMGAGGAPGQSLLGPKRKS